MDDAVNNVTDQALSGNPIAIVLLIAALVYMADKVWYHGDRIKKKKEGDPLHDQCLERVSVHLEETATLHRETADSLRSISNDMRDMRGDMKVLLDRGDR